MGKYHTMLSSVFDRAIVDRVVTFNPCAHTDLPKRVKKKSRTLTPDEYDAIFAALPAQHRLMVETAINTGLTLGRAHRRREACWLDDPDKLRSVLGSSAPGPS